MTPLQAAVGVVQKVIWCVECIVVVNVFKILQRVCDCQGLRPTIPKNTHPKLAELLERLWEQDSTQRPDFSEIIEQLQEIAKEVNKRIWIEGNEYMSKWNNGRVKSNECVCVCV